MKSPSGTGVSPHSPAGTPFQAPVTLTCSSSSSFTSDQLLTKLSFSRARMGELSRTVSRRVRPEPGAGERQTAVCPVS